MTGWQYTQNRLTAVTSRNWTFTYDLNGNRATANWNGTVHGYAYDPFGNLIVVSGPIGYHAVYDAFGRRVRYETPQGEFTFIYEGDTLFGEADIDGMRAVYIWGLLGPIARIDLRSPSGTRYYVVDGLGHTRLLLDSSVKNRRLRRGYTTWGRGSMTPARRGGCRKTR